MPVDGIDSMDRPLPGCIVQAMQAMRPCMLGPSCLLGEAELQWCCCVPAARMVLAGGLVGSEWVPGYLQRVSSC
jgi:hypothetical protein